MVQHDFAADIKVVSMVALSCLRENSDRAEVCMGTISVVPQAQPIKEGFRH